jgi:3-oxoadipate enol-lactonase
MEMKSFMRTPLVFLHGFPLDNAMWFDQVEHFKEKHPIICPDLPGFGSSQEKTPQMIEGFAKSIRDLLDEKGIEDIILGGFSMGGYIAFAFYDMFPEIVKGLIFIDTKASADSEDGKTGRNNAIKELSEKGIKSFAKTMPQKLLSENGSKDEELLKYVRDMILNQRPESIKNALIAMRDRKDRTHVLSIIKVPALFVCGEKDVLTPPSEMATMAKNVEGSFFSLVKGAGHLSNLENPKDFNLAIDMFLNSSQGGIK